MNKHIFLRASPRRLDVRTVHPVGDPPRDRGLRQLVGTDPFTGCQLDSELLDHAASEEAVRAFCRHLMAARFRPLLVVTDGSKLYPPVTANVWPAFWAAFSPPRRQSRRKA